MTSVSNGDRQTVSETLFWLIRKIETKKGTGQTDDSIRAVVQKWEQNVYDKFSTNRATYLDKFRMKESQCQKQLEELNAASPAVTSQIPPQPNTVHKSLPSTAPQASAPQRSVPPQTSSIQSGSTGIPKLGSAPSQASKPVSAVDKPSVAQVSSSRNPALVRIEEPRKIDDLREPLEECRAILRVINVFGISKRDQQAKNEFLKIFEKTTNAIKKQKTQTATREEIEREVKDIASGLAQLKEQVQPRIKEIQRNLEADTFEQMFKMEGLLFGIMDRYWEIHGKDRYQKRLESVSELIGGNFAGLNKRQRTQN